MIDADAEAAAALMAIARAVAPLVAEVLANKSELISQKDSPLGRRTHCAVVRSRVERGAGGASIVGRRFYLTREALSEEIAARGKPRPRPQQKPDPAADIKRRFPLERVG